MKLGRPTLVSVGVHTYHPDLPCLHRSRPRPAEMLAVHARQAWEVVACMEEWQWHYIVSMTCLSYCSGIIFTAMLEKVCKWMLASWHTTCDTKCVEDFPLAPRCRPHWNGQSSKFCIGFDCHSIPINPQYDQLQIHCYYCCCCCCGENCGAKRLSDLLVVVEAATLGWLEVATVVAKLPPAWFPDPMSKCGCCLAWDCMRHAKGC